MITLKLPYKNNDSTFQEYLYSLRKAQSIIIRSAYNRFDEEMEQKEVRHYVSNLSNVEMLDSWMIQSGVMEGQYLKSVNKDKSIVFGGKNNFYLRSKDKIDSIEFKKKRLMKLIIQGESLQKGNRKFELNILNNQIIFKPKKGIKYILELPKIKKNWLKQLFRLEENCLNKKQPYQIKLDEEFIYITFKKIKEQNIEKLNQSRFIGIDMNPESVGVSVCEWNDGEMKILEAKQYNVSKIVKKLNDLNVKTSDPKFKSLNNKLNHETIEISKAIVRLAKKWNCRFVFVEDLNFKSVKPKGRVFNRLTRNYWKRTRFVQSLKKGCDLNKISMFGIGAFYSSYIGNLVYDYVDAVNASLEVGRRGYEVIILKNKKFYPDFNLSLLKDQWKDRFSNGIEKIPVTESVPVMGLVWKDVFGEIKNSRLRYRVSLDDCKRLFEVLRFCSDRSRVEVYSFY